MATGTITAIQENGIALIFSVTINGAIYSVAVSKSVFDALINNVDKQNYIINLLSATRRNNRIYENAYATLIGNVIIIPD